MKKNFAISLLVCCSFFLCQCDNNEGVSNEPAGQNEVLQDPQTRSVDERKSKEIRLNAELAWKEAKKITFSESDFLKTKGKMSLQAIDYLTLSGWNNDFAYNQIVYMQALQRAKKHLSIVNNQFICSLKSGAEINIAEDLYEFIINLFDDWNKWINEGRVEIVKVDDYYEIETILPRSLKIMSPRYSVDLTSMSQNDCWLSIKDLVDECPLGTYLSEYFVLNFGDDFGGTFTGTDGKLRRYSVTDACSSHGVSDDRCIHNRINHNAYISDYMMHIYSIRNNNFLSIASYQIQK